MTEDVETVRNLLIKKEYKKVKELLDKLLADDKENDEFLFLRGVLSLKLKNYKRAIEFFEHALAINDKPEYNRMEGMAFFEIFDIENAIDAFKKSLDEEPDDAVTHFFLSICYMLTDDPKSAEHIKKAHEIDSKKTKQLISNFYTLFLEKDPRISDVQKQRIVEQIKSIE